MMFTLTQVSAFEAAMTKFLGAPPVLDRPESIAPLNQKLASAVESRAIPMHLAYHRFKDTGYGGDALKKVIQQQQATRDLEAALASKMGLTDVQTVVRNTVQFNQCHAEVVRAFGATCGFTEHNMRVSATLYRLCEHTAGSAAPVIAAVESVCGSAAEVTPLGEAGIAVAAGAMKCPGDPQLTEGLSPLTHSPSPCRLLRLGAC